MNLYTITNVLFKFGSLERLYVETKSKKRFKLLLNLYVHVKFRRTCIYAHAITDVKAPYIVFRL